MTNSLPNADSGTWCRSVPKYKSLIRCHSPTDYLAQACWGIGPQTTTAECTSRDGNDLGGSVR